MRLTLTAAATAILSISVAAPLGAGHDDDLTRYEISQLRQALAEIGCHGGEFDKKRNGYEVEDTRCPDGKEYEFRFSRDFVIIGGERD